MLRIGKLNISNQTDLGGISGTALTFWGTAVPRQRTQTDNLDVGVYREVERDRF